MRIVRVDETLKQGGFFRMHHISDIHAGAPDFDEDALKERVALIKDDPNARWTMGGDGGDLIRHSDRRYSPTELAMRYRMATDVRTATKEHLCEMLEPIAKKCWGWADGNHERAMDEHNGGKFGVETCCELGIEHLWVGYNGFVHVQITIGTTRLRQLLDLQHGWQAGRLKGGPMVQAERELGMTAADIVLRGHNHSPMAHVFMTRDVTAPGRGGRPRVVLRPRTVLNGGTWRRGYRDDLEPVNRKKLSEVEGDMWQETKGFRTEPLGGPVLVIRVDKGSSTDDGQGSTNTRSATISHTVINGLIDGLSLGISK